MKLFGDTIQSLEKSMQYSSMKNKAISNNLANIDTPNYKAQSIDFKNVLQDESSKIQLRQTNMKHIPSSGGSPTYAMRTNQHTIYNHNGNNVDVDKEMADLAENQIYYRSLVDRINGKFQGLQTVIRGGK